MAGEGDLERASELLAGQGAGIILETGPVFSSHRAQVITLAASKSLPMIYEWRDFVSDGGLMSYGTDRARVTRQAGIYAGRILKGEKVSDMPVVQPDKLRAADQPQDSQDARPHDPRQAARARR